MKASIKKGFLTLIVFPLVFSATAWGPTGHRATGWTAEQYLTKKAAKALRDILDGQSLAIASTWMDEIRSDSIYDYTADWHWVTIPDGKTYEESEKNPNGDIIQTIERLVIGLKSGKLSKKEEIESIKMLIHLVGDIHQPLHVGRGDDRGGNDVKIKWFGGDSNLHRVWDSQMIDETRLSYTELAASLQTPGDAVVAAWQKTTVRDWANESMTLRESVYDYGNGRLGYEYSYHNFPVVRKRLLQAGIRLAGLLNDIYG